MLRLCFSMLTLAGVSVGAAQIQASQFINVACLNSFLKSQALSNAPVVHGLASQLQEIFVNQPMLAVERAVADGLARALNDEGMDTAEVVCNRDYSRLCPEGSSSQRVSALSFASYHAFSCKDGLTQAMATRAWQGIKSLFQAFCTHGRRRRKHIRAMKRS